MSCPYSEVELEKWDGVSNPMGKECSVCYECGCEHWDDCPDDCSMADRISHDCKKWYPSEFDLCPA